MIFKLIKYRKALACFFIVEEHFSAVIKLRKIALESAQVFTSDQRKEVLYRMLPIAEYSGKDIINCYGVEDSLEFTRILNNLLCIGRDHHVTINTCQMTSSRLNETILEQVRALLKIIAKKKVNLL
jgi:hypothetical protein